MNPFAIAHAIRKKNSPQGEQKEIDPNYKAEDLGRLASTRGPTAIAAAILAKKSAKSEAGEEEIPELSLDTESVDDLYEPLETIDFDEPTPEDPKLKAKNTIASIFENL